MEEEEKWERSEWDPDPCPDCLTIIVLPFLEAVFSCTNEVALGEGRAKRDWAKETGKKKSSMPVTCGVMKSCPPLSRVLDLDSGLCYFVLQTKAKAKTIRRNLKKSMVASCFLLSRIAVCF